MKESTKQYLNSKYGTESIEIDNFINSQILLDYINNNKYETFKCYQHRKRKQFLETTGTILTIILFIITLYFAFISLPL